ncbi:MAG: penicillin-binding protein [Rhodospirillaceae bacterium]|nr:MAG: penicillin-binding protein [Rhodospirillaceae bacterium]
MGKLLKIFWILLSLGFIGGIAAAGGLIYVFWHFGQDLPDYQQLADYEPAVMTRVHAGDGQLLAEYATERRVFVPVRAMPRQVIGAVLAAEDKNFYTHSGVDFLSLVRALVTNIKNIGSGRRPVGASTLTQQVAKNFLLTNEVSYERKIKEAILAFRIEKAFSKQRILELYLNEVYLGYGSFGVAAAALNYFDKPLDQLSIAQSAYLAALLKAPANYHPIRKKEAALIRRNWVIGRMLIDERISVAEATMAKAEPLKVVNRSDTQFVKADFFAEEVRRELADLYGDNALYTGGMSVQTTLDPRLQVIAGKALRDGLIAYDRRHGWRGAISNISEATSMVRSLETLKPPKGLDPWKLAVVEALDDKTASIIVQGLGPATLPLKELKWARVWMKGEKRGDRIRKPADVLIVGDVVAVEPVLTYTTGSKKDNTIKTHDYPENTYGLRQIPAIQGAIVALNPHTGRVLAMSGGFAYEASQFNRATQAKRQPGSAFKPFVYLAGLDSGFTPASLILDAPFVIDQGKGLPKWRPANYTKKFYGPSTMRLGIQKSRNLMTVRLAQNIGMEKIAEYAAKFGVIDNLSPQLAMSLGAGETTLLRLTAGYGELVNGGKKIQPTFIDRIQDRNGTTIYKHDKRPCVGCDALSWTGQAVPEIPDLRKQLTDPASAYQMVSMLEGTIQRGTGRRAKAVGKPLGGKTGTTNDGRDAWFIGFSPDLAVGVFTGFDVPRSLGKNEQGASVALPIWTDFMKGALADSPAIPFRIPPGILLVRVNATTGLPVRVGERNWIQEAFKPGTVPTSTAQVIGQEFGDIPGTIEGGNEAPTTGTGGLY